MLVASNLLDDGAIVYLNGHEAGRDGVQDGFGPSVLAESGTEVRQGGGRAMHLPVQNLRQGTNVIAVELHQSSRTSDDAVFAMSLWADKVSDGEPVFLTHPDGVEAFPGERVELRAEARGNKPMVLRWIKDGQWMPGATGTVLRISRVGSEDGGVYGVTASNAVGLVASSNAILDVKAPGIVPFHFPWKYHLAYAPFSNRWLVAGFDDKDWPMGETPIGANYRPDYSSPAKPYRTLLVEVFDSVDAGTRLPLVSLFRTSFIWPHPDAEADLRITSMIDDAGIVNLNGEAILHVGMFPARVAHMTQANRRVANPVLETFSVPGIQLLHGTNVVAVSVHQSTWSSGDMSFALRMEVERFKPSPAVKTEASAEGPARIYIPHGAPERSKRARSSIRTASWSEFEAISATSLHPGTNCLAVELRRSPGSDRDLVFACELVIEAGADP